MRLQLSKLLYVLTLISMQAHGALVYALQTASGSLDKLSIPALHIVDAGLSWLEFRPGRQKKDPGVVRKAGGVGTAW